MMATILIAAFIVVFTGYAIGIYNNLVRKRQLLFEAASGIDVQLKRRWELIPKIVDTVKGYAGHEKGLLEKVTTMRAQMVSSVPLSKRSQSETELSTTLKSIFALAEAYPELKANQNFLQLQQTLSDIEDQIQMARRYYNATVRDYNILCQQFPSVLVANILGFKPEKFFELEYATERQTPEIKFE
ncbi:MAG: LemA family protein [Candidatus Omnitrophica bacterium]|nr:LemA family protein [Candidatus Omnitrophota bacterium]